MPKTKTTQEMFERLVGGIKLLLMSDKVRSTRQDVQKEGSLDHHVVRPRG